MLQVVLEAKDGRNSGSFQAKSRIKNSKDGAENIAAFDGAF
ncbi:MAG TPA: hypothetical protein VKS21_04805 [Spirochaetota bacterium]|nr:hypothetical protein [Spirochaetota bacterium]